jgi:hypothetical protein
MLNGPNFPRNNVSGDAVRAPVVLTIRHVSSLAFPGSDGAQRHGTSTSQDCGSEVTERKGNHDGFSTSHYPSKASAYTLR